MYPIASVLYSDQYCEHYSCHCRRAGTNCDLFVLTKTDLDQALKYYPHIAEQIQEVANNRANLVKKRSQIAAKAAAEGKSASDAAKAAAQGTKDEGEEDDGKKKEAKPKEEETGTSSTPQGGQPDTAMEFEGIITPVLYQYHVNF